MSLFTIFGGTGFIGRHLAATLKRDGHDVISLGRNIDFSTERDLGHVIYAAGCTGSAAVTPNDMLYVHAALPDRAMRHFKFSSWVYISSTRVYGLEGQSTSTQEDAAVTLSTTQADWFSLTKLCGESLCLNSGYSGVSIARLSNIYGLEQHPSTFLSALRRSCLEGGGCTINESPDSRKDYLSIQDAVHYLSQLAITRSEGIYNVASGNLVTHRQLAEQIKAVGYNVDFSEHGQTRAFPMIDVCKLHTNFGVPRHNLVSDIKDLFKRTP